MFVEDEPGQQAGVAATHALAPALPIACQLLLYRFPDGEIDNGEMPAWVDDALVRDSAEVDGIGENAIQVTAAEGSTADGIRPSRDAWGRGPTAALKLRLQSAHATQRTVERVDLPHSPRLELIDDQAALGRKVADRWDAAHPKSLLLGGGNLVANALTGDFALELGERQQHVQREASHRAGGIELLGDQATLVKSGQIKEIAAEAARMLHMKRLAFEYEREVRIVWVEKPIEDVVERYLPILDTAMFDQVMIGPASKNRTVKGVTSKLKSFSVSNVLQSSFYQEPTE